MLLWGYKHHSGYDNNVLCAQLKEKLLITLFVIPAIHKTLLLQGNEQFCWQSGKSGNHMLWLNSAGLVKLLIFSSQLRVLSKLGEL